MSDPIETFKIMAMFVFVTGVALILVATSRPF